MELNEQDDEELEDQLDSSPIPMVQDDDDTVHLPEEWIFEFQEKTQSQSSVRESNISKIIVSWEHTQKVPKCHEMLQDTQCGPVQEDEPLGTQPTKGDLEKAKQIDDLGKAKKRGKKNQWGPNVTLRRSSRNADDGRTILDKAQEFKRKWNLESNAGINAKAQNHVSKALLVSVAKDLNVLGVDGNPQVLDRMITLDR